MRAREKGRFRKPVLDFQNTRFKLAELKSEIQIAQVFVDRCMELALKNELDPTTAAMAKYWCTDLQCKVVDECMQFSRADTVFMQEYAIARALGRCACAENLWRHQRNHERHHFPAVCENDDAPIGTCEDNSGQARLPSCRRRGSVVTYAELDDVTMRGARCLRGLGIAPGEHIAIFMENNRHYLAIVWAAQRAGIIVTPISSHSQVAEALYILDKQRLQGLAHLGEDACRRRAAPRGGRAPSRTS